MKEELDSICKECKKENKKIKVYDLGVALSLFILASVWRSADKYKTNKLWPILSKISVIGILVYSIYQGYIKWIIQD